MSAAQAKSVAWFPRLALAATAFAFALVGGWLLVDPEAIGVAGVALTDAGAHTEIRGFYGGLELGFALFLALAARRSVPVEAVSSALLAGAFVLGGIVFGRCVGFVVDGETPPLIFLFAAFESSGAVVCALALRTLKRKAKR